MKIKSCEVEELKKGMICYIFDRLLMSPVKAKFIGINDSDKWMRFQYLEHNTSACGHAGGNYGSHYEGFTSFPQEAWGETVCLTYHDCILAAIVLLNKRLDSKG